MLNVPELQPLLDKVAVLKDNPDARDVHDHVLREVTAAATPAMGQAACARIRALCDPGAWGDRHVHGLGPSFLGWIKFLGELKGVANACGQQLLENDRGQGQHPG